MANEAFLYPWSQKDAQDRNEQELWHESRSANISCRKAIESAINQGFDGQSLAPDCAESVIGEYGYKRVRFVLANTVEYRRHEETFSSDDLSWAKQVYVPEDSLPEISAANPLPALETFLAQYKNAYQALGMFDHTHCEADAGELDYTGKVLVLSPDILKESCWRQEDQLWYAYDGFGCRPHARGRSIRCECLGDGEQTRWNRTDFVGVLKDEHLPQWARERLEQITAPKPSEAPKMEGMKMI
ncbi:MAG: DUF3849 domain-containing protein [Oscillospiraceae bacterium]|jgi:hypothetical protein|nr:DUF3849 domain-containing protein [Oscillospiraceae bacterium]